MVHNSSDEHQLSSFALPFTPRYAEHFVGAAALIGAFALVFGAMALGEHIKADTAKVACASKPVGQVCRCLAPVQDNACPVQICSRNRGTGVSKLEA